MIYLNAEVISGLGDDTFWLWFEREFEASFDIPTELKDDDILLHYSTLGACNIKGGRKIALCWELYPEMKRQLQSNQWDKKIALTYEAAQSCDETVVANIHSQELYGGTILPIGVADVFQPALGKLDSYNIPLDKRVGMWCGTDHPMKGFDILQTYMKENPEIYWIIVWKDRHFPKIEYNGQSHARVNQQTLADLMNCADFFADVSRLRPYYMVEWEAMACGLPLKKIGETKREFQPSSCPVADVIMRNWTRVDAKRIWQKYLSVA